MRPAPRTAAQNRRIYGLRAELGRQGLEAEDVAGVVREICMEVSGQEHTSRLTDAQATRVIAALEERVKRAQAPKARRTQAAPAPHEPWGERGAEDRASAPVTERQLEILGCMFADAGMAALPQRVAFTARQLQGRRRIETQRDADKLMEGLKAIILRGVTAEGLLERVAVLEAHPQLRADAWLCGFVADVKGRVMAQGKKAITPGRLAKLVEAEALCGLGPSAAVEGA